MYFSAAMTSATASLKTENFTLTNARHVPPPQLMLAANVKTMAKMATIQRPAKANQFMEDLDYRYRSSAYLVVK